MTMVSFTASSVARHGYLALPPGGQGKGILVLHAWWGLNDFFKSTCDRLAAQGFVAFAPDLHHGKIAKTIDEANHLLETRDFPAVQATAEAGLQLLQSHPSVQGSKLGALGFSMGAAFAVLLDSLYPDAFDRIVAFYGASEEDLSGSKAQFQLHFGDNDDWEPMESVKKLAGANLEIYIYPGIGHWFFEEDRSDHYTPDVAKIAWARTLDFLGRA